MTNTFPSTRERCYIISFQLMFIILRGVKVEFHILAQFWNDLISLWIIFCLLDLGIKSLTLESNTKYGIVKKYCPRKFHLD